LPIGKLALVLTAGIVRANYTTDQQGRVTTTLLNDNARYWVAGFIEGEGSFNVSFKLRSDSKLGFYPSPSFSVTQHSNGLSALELCKQALNNVGSAITGKSGNPSVMLYQVTNLSDLLTVVIPFLQQYNQLSARKNELAMFVEVCFAQGTWAQLVISRVSR
jgi:hypothetical protein